jgi:hypothetical protein
MTGTLQGAYRFARRWPISPPRIPAPPPGSGGFVLPLVAAVAVLPLLALHLTHPHDALAVVETAGKSVRLLRRKLTLTGAASVALGVLALGLAALTVGYMLTGDSPLEGAARTVALAAAGMLATFGVNHLWQRSSVGAER